ncbi:protein AF1q isoform X2 [Anarhichas minor]|uniref:protein AF1q isoform X2 n=1 Tax=Anarhichas minor TaxID=65739 RepID=UPI003F736A9A
MQKSRSQYDSFLFWRQPIAALDLSELEDIGLTGALPANSIKGKDKSSTLRTKNEERTSRIHQKEKQQLILSECKRCQQ